MPKRRGRKPSSVTAMPGMETTMPKRRGRKPKVQMPEASPPEVEMMDAPVEE